MFNVFWSSLLVIANMVTDWDKKYRLPIYISKDNQKCYDYNMDDITFQSININNKNNKCNKNDKNDKIVPYVKRDITEVYENI